MNITNIKSSQINSINYNEETEILEVKFKKGYSYEYYRVPKEAVGKLIDAESIGQHFNIYVAKCYEYKKLEN